MARPLIIVGTVLLLAGLLWPMLTKLGLGRLPGDVVIETAHFRFYAPIVTSLIVSLLLSAILWLLQKFL